MSRQPDGKVVVAVECEDDGSDPRICLDIIQGRIFTFNQTADAYLSLGDAAALAEQLDSCIDEIAHLTSARGRIKAARISRLEETLAELKGRS